MSRPVEFFDQAFASGDFTRYWDTYGPSSELAALVVAGLIPNHARVLDLGCGAGKESIFLAQCGHRVSGVDFSEKGLEIARRLAAEAGVDVDFRHASVLDLPLADAAFDFANDRGCFHHIPEDKRPQYAAEVARVLKPGARLLLRGVCDPRETTFVLVNEEVIARYFSERFTWDAIVTINLSQNRVLPGKMVLLQRK